MKVLLTRPQGSNDAMLQSLKQLGIEAIETPLMVIEPLTPCQSDITQLQLAQKIIFISQHAVFHSHFLIENLSSDTQVFAVGQHTAKALKQKNISAMVTDISSQDSEGLLALPDLHAVANENIVIVRGRGGREKLAAELTLRGAKVSYCEVYNRVRPQLDGKLVCQYWQQQGIDIILITSGEMLSNLLKLIPDDQLGWLKQCRLIVPSVRVAGIALDAEFINVINAGGADMSAMLFTLTKFIATSSN